MKLPSRKLICAALFAIIPAPCFAAPAPLVARETASAATASRPMVMNLSWITGSEGAFLNNFKNCGGFTSNAGYAFPLILNADGNPTTTPTSTITCTIPEMPKVDNPEWTVGWSGTLRVALIGPSGAIIVNGDKRCVISQASGSITLGGTNCSTRIVFASAASSLTVQFPNSGAYSNPSNLYMVRSDEKMLFDAGEIFRPASAGMLLAKLKDLGVKTLRFLDWSEVATNNNVSQWDYLSRPSSFSYGAARWEPTVFPGTPGSGVASSPISGTNTYQGVATVNSTKSYVDGQVYQNLVTNANTSTTPTLSIGGGPAVTIVDLSGAPLKAGAIANNQLATFVYNAKLNKWFYRAGGMTTRVPVQIITALCNKLMMNCWYQFPLMFTKASMASYAVYVRSSCAVTHRIFRMEQRDLQSISVALCVGARIGHGSRFP